MKREKKEEEKKADEIRRHEMEKIMKNYDDFLIQTEKAKQELKKVKAVNLFFISELNIIEHW